MIILLTIKIKIMNYLFLDIETIPTGEYPSLDEIEVPGNYKTPEAINKYKVENQEKQFRKRALISTEGQIICISMVLLEEHEFPPQDEREVEDRNAWTSISLFIDNNSTEQVARGVREEVELLRLLDTNLEDFNANELIFVGHNIKNFDLKWLLHRAYKYNCLNLIRLLPKSRYDKNVIDTMEQFNGTAAGAHEYVSLDSICKYLGVPTSKGELDGSKVYDYYLEGKIDEIVKYCEKDVEVVVGIFMKMNPDINL